jgi:hypothetical protein
MCAFDNRWEFFPRAQAAAISTTPRDTHDVIATLLQCRSNGTSEKTGTTGNDVAFHVAINTKARTIVRAGFGIVQS